MSRPADRVLRHSTALSAEQLAAREQAAQEYGRRMAAEVKATIPAAIPFIADLAKLGMIDGWRSVTYVGPRKPRDPNAMTLDRMCLESDFIAMQQKRGRA